jgi:dTDP-4-dehydrorhamnose 3,5-epimerase
MQVTPTILPEVKLIEPAIFRDARGYFLESFHADRFRAAGLPVTFVQDNHSRSVAGVLRGLHYQLRHPQGKLIRVVTGRVYDVVVDIRRGSPRFGQWFGIELSADNHRQLYVPPGFAHGFCALSEVTDFLYKCTEVYAPDDEYGIAWNDPELAIDWPEREFLLSDKDRALPGLRGNKHLPEYSDPA